MGHGAFVPGIRLSGFRFVLPHPCARKKAQRWGTGPLLTGEALYRGPGVFQGMKMACDADHRWSIVPDYDGEP
jgi:hypothetical protein